MRLWSLHPKYLDQKGLVALWREGLLAKKVLEGKTRGYKNHPQLIRFKNSPRPLDSINHYLHIVCDEAEVRAYSFDRSKLTRRHSRKKKIKVTSGQVEYEWKHLLKKLATRSPQFFSINVKVRAPDVHPLFERVEGTIEFWEVVDRGPPKPL